VSILVFGVSVLGIIINRSNTLLILVCIELMLLSIIITVVISTIKTSSILGQTFALYIATVAAVESAIGLSILIGFYKIRGSISLRVINMLKG
jgi:NADH:ubiquinone oxidoreductase subunit K